MPSSLIRTAAASATTAVLLTAGAAVAVDRPTDTTMSVGPQVRVAAPSPSPVDFPGFRHDRPGRPLPRGYVAISHAITMTRGDTTTIYPALRLRCPKGKTLRTMAAEGDVGPQIVGPDPFTRRRSFDYSGRSSWGVIVDYNARTVKVGQTISGKVHALCR